MQSSGANAGAVPKERLWRAGALRQTRSLKPVARQGALTPNWTIPAGLLSPQCRRLTADSRAAASKRRRAKLNGTRRPLSKVAIGRNQTRSWNKTFAKAGCSEGKSEAKTVFCRALRKSIRKKSPGHLRPGPPKTCKWRVKLSKWKTLAAVKSSERAQLNAASKRSPKQVAATARLKPKPFFGGRGGKVI